jgi:hypothetical protein
MLMGFDRSYFINLHYKLLLLQSVMGSLIMTLKIQVTIILSVCSNAFIEVKLDFCCCSKVSVLFFFQGTFKMMVWGP